MLEEQEKQVLYEEIARYAKEVAGTSDDLDEQLEAVGVEQTSLPFVFYRFEKG